MLTANNHSSRVDLPPQAKPRETTSLFPSGQTDPAAGLQLLQLPRQQSRHSSQTALPYAGPGTYAVATSRSGSSLLLKVHRNSSARVVLNRNHGSRIVWNPTALRVLLRTALMMGLGSFVLCILGTVLIKIIFADVSFAGKSGRSTAPPYNTDSTGNSYLFLGVIFAMVSSVLSIIGTVFINIIIDCVTSQVQPRC